MTNFLHQTSSNLGAAASWNIKVQWTLKYRRFMHDPIKRNLDIAFRAKRGEPSWWEEFTDLVPQIYDFTDDVNKKAILIAKLRKLYSNYPVFYQQLSDKDRKDQEKMLITFVIAYCYLVPEGLEDVFVYTEQPICDIYRCLPKESFNKLHALHCKFTWSQESPVFNDPSVLDLISTLSRCIERQDYIDDDSCYSQEFLGDEAFKEYAELSEDVAFKLKAAESCSLLNCILKKHFPNY